MNLPTYLSLSVTKNMTPCWLVCVTSLAWTPQPTCPYLLQKIWLPVDWYVSPAWPEPPNPPVPFCYKKYDSLLIGTCHQPGLNPPTHLSLSVKKNMTPCWLVRVTSLAWTPQPTCPFLLQKIWLPDDWYVSPAWPEPPNPPVPFCYKKYDSLLIGTCHQPGLNPPTHLSLSVTKNMTPCWLLCVTSLAWTPQPTCPFLLQKTQALYWLLCVTARPVPGWGRPPAVAPAPR